MTEFVKVRSWHILSGLVSRAGHMATNCGRWVDVNSPKLPDPPANQKTCETCYRIEDGRKRA